jgi:hypothetical protein
MDDIYSAILGEPTSDREKLLMVAAQLRKQQQIGQLGQVTGDRVLAPIGAGLAKEASMQAEDIGQRGEQARYRKYQEGTSLRTDQRERTAQAWREKDAIAERAHRAGLERARNATVLEAARIRNTDTPETKYKQMTVPQVTKLSEGPEKYRKLQNVISGFKDEYASPVPTLRPLANALAANVPIASTQNAKDAQNWWAMYHNIYTLGERNKLFGATLTDNEQREWKKNAIGENMSPEQIKTRLAWLEENWGSEIAAAIENLKAANFDPELVDTIFTNPLGEDDEVEDLPARP